MPYLTATSDKTFAFSIQLKCHCSGSQAKPHAADRITEAIAAAE